MHFKKKLLLQGFQATMAWKGVKPMTMVTTCPTAATRAAAIRARWSALLVATITARAGGAMWTLPGAATMSSSAAVWGSQKAACLIHRAEHEKCHFLT
mmetsp:Transcript_80061/g.132288  ORF Transcript_80061/g.132288 Transcript_80061/m.132288 type:complete len:98 (-) Transcript_80061:1766-2059(-)